MNIPKVLYTVLTIILLIVIAITAFYLWQKQERIPEEESELLEIQNDWKTYRSDRNKFEMRYPGDLQVKETFDAVAFSVSKGPEDVEDFLFMIFYTEDLETEIKKRREFLFNNKTFRIENAAEEEILVDNITATKLSAKIFSLLPELNFEYSNQIDIFIGGGRNLHIFGFISPEDEKEYHMLFDTMLSTFKFIK